jgi:hypothetical protein
MLQKHFDCVRHRTDGLIEGAVVRAIVYELTPDRRIIIGVVDMIPAMNRHRRVEVFREVRD